MKNVCLRESLDPPDFDSNMKANYYVSLECYRANGYRDRRLDVLNIDISVKQGTNCLDVLLPNSTVIISYNQYFLLE